jgi:hypothetical protein
MDTIEVLLCRVKPTSGSKATKLLIGSRQAEVLYGQRIERLGSALLRRSGGE